MTVFDDAISGTPAPCPWCGDMQDAASFIGKGVAVPEAGDPCLCVTCLRVSIYTGVGLTRRKPTREEAERIAADPAIGIAQRRLRIGRPLEGE